MKILADSKIPFLKGRMEHLGEVVYLSPGEFSSEAVKDADILVVRTRVKCNEELLKGSKVRHIVTATIGTDHIDTGWCEANGIEVRNAAGCNSPAVAQYVWASLLHNGFEPSSSTMGIIGYGNIGHIVAMWAKELGCKVLVNDPPRNDAGFKDIEYVPLDNLLKESDVVTVHTPFTVEGPYKTKGLISGRELEMMKPGAWLVNAARGGIVDEKALIDILPAKRFRCVIDVWENEPYINRELLQRSLVATPHIAGYSLEGKLRATDMAVNACEDFIKNKGEKEKGADPDTKGGERQNLLLPAEEDIKNSYNPEADTRMLREAPENFERLRENYNYRNEVLCSVQG